MARDTQHCRAGLFAVAPFQGLRGARTRLLVRHRTELSISSPTFNHTHLHLLSALRIDFLAISR
jgi:hypothetical protein